MPFVIRYPREIDPGSRISDLILNVDFAPLFLDYAGLPVPDWMQGSSFKAILADHWDQ
jgi:arylsulfatase A-like enzyme